MPKKLKIQDEYVPKNVSLIGIVSNLFISKLAWHLNKEMYFDFVDTDPFYVADTQKNFLQFKYKDNSKKISYILVENRNEQGVLFNTYKNIDFILKVGGNTDYVGDLCSKLRNLEGINGVFLIIKT